MKVLHLLGELRASGAEVMLKVAAPYWLEEDFEMTILSTGSVVGNYAEVLNTAGYLISHIPFQKNLTFFLRLWKFIKELRFDVIHIHTEQAYFFIGLLSWLSGTQRILRTIHSCFEFKGFLRIRRGIQRRIMNLCGITQVSISQAVQNNELRRFKNQTKLIPNWYDDSRFYPVKPDEKSTWRSRIGIDPDSFVIISVGNCSPVKNHGIIFRAIKQMPNNDKLLYLHVGEEDKNHSERKLVEELALEKKVRFVGYQPDVRPYLWASDVFLLTSFYEGFGISALEAVACGLPAILSDIEGLSFFRAISKNISFIDPSSSGLTTALLAQYDAFIKGYATCLSQNHDLATWHAKPNIKRYSLLYRFGIIPDMEQ